MDEAPKGLDSDSLPVRVGRCRVESTAGLSRQLKAFAND
jgi:hypothetical protein